MTESPPSITWCDDGILEVDGTRFLVSEDPSVYRSAVSDDQRFLLVKSPEYIRECIERFAAERPRTVLELGVFQGGSVAFWNLLLRPDRQLVVDLYARDVPPLDTFLAGPHHGQLDVRYRIDQADRPALEAVLDDCFGEEPLDLVIDDASHMYFETRSSFETILPRLRPGATFVIEDWGWAHDSYLTWDTTGFAYERPALSNLVVEIMMVAKTSPDVVAEVRLTAHACQVTRGPAALEPGVELASLYANRGLPYRPLL